ncbi:UvrD-helicase domain-containing protein [Kitasatospora sp. NPDC091335]|uniref:UvrD-helicase domain-containing protein n=1 Tax=Kitasatospora sp. NPDC091335 TaxID=3364085 RepID=UPI003815F3A6
MAELTVLTRIQQVLDARRDFLVEAGAGAGKTTALVHSLLYLLRTRRDELERAGKRIACITYTNVAKEEIRERIGDDPLVYVGTIHEFLWMAIQDHQSELLDALIAHNQTLARPQDMAEIKANLVVEYSDRRRRYADGLISHDEVLALAYTLITTRPKLVRITADRFPVIFVDEYQDTFPRTIEVLLDHFAGSGTSVCTIGLFGDSMQKIYNTGVGKVTHERLVSFTMHGNHRCAEPIVDVLNRIRPELRQVHDAGNTDGQVHLFLTRKPLGGDTDPRDVLTPVLDSYGWAPERTKYLVLTHRRIAGALGYQDLLALYTKRYATGRDDLLEGTEPYAQLLKSVEELSSAFESRNYAQLTALLDGEHLAITRHSDKVRTTRTLQGLIDVRGTGTVGDVLDYVISSRLLTPSGRVRAIERTLQATDLDERAQKDADFVNALRALPYHQVVNLTRFRDELTPFSTQHGVKGAEFENVVVIIDDQAWNQFNVDRMLSGDDHIRARETRTRNLFYVCCSRARKRLAVVFTTPLGQEAEAMARAWFGSAHVHEGMF